MYTVVQVLYDEWDGPTLIYHRSKSWTRVNMTKRIRSQCNVPHFSREIHSLCHAAGRTVELGGDRRSFTSFMKLRLHFP